MAVVFIRISCQLMQCQEVMTEKIEVVRAKIWLCVIHCEVLYVTDGDGV